MKHKSSVFCIIMMLSVFALLFAGCGSGGAEEPGGGTIAPGTPTPAGTKGPNTPGQSEALEDVNYITSLDAAAMAYAEAVKLYDDAVLWSMINGIGTALHYDWTNTDSCHSWTVDFVSPKAGKLIYVYIFGNEISRTLVDDKNNFTLDQSLPKDRPLMSMAEAAKEVIENGGITGLIPVNAGYEVSGYYDNDFPYWGFTYRVPLGNGEYERHFYYVNAATGKFAEVKYRNNDNDTISQENLVVKGTDLSHMAWMQDQDLTLKKFLTLINEGKTEDAIGMMDDAAAPDKNSRDMWADSFDSIRGVKFVLTGFSETDEENWTDEIQRYKVKMQVPESGDYQQFGWEPGENTRFFTLMKYGGEWKIHEISTGF
ncbi:MAG: hypothetical protein JXB33_00335 [Clostridia bacterium]|nr:hypothetical protein [Clostridia bacterium]